MDDRDVGDLIGLVVTHKHADHCLDMMALAYRLLFPVPTSCLPLYGPLSLEQTIFQYDKIFGIPSLPMLESPISTAFEFIPVIPGEKFTVAGTWTFDTLSMRHPVETLALRSFEFGFVYTADGAYTEDLQKFCKGCNCLISEATYPEEDGHDLNEHGHMTAAICATLAEDSETQHLVVTHLSDPADSKLTMMTIKRQFKGNARLAQPGLEIQLHRQGK